MQRAAQLGRVVVSLNTDEFAARYKRRPVMTLDERREVVAACRWVETVIVNEGGEDSKPAIESAKPHFIVHGDDWTGDSFLRQLGVTREWLEERGISLVYLPYTAGISTSDVIERCHG